MTTARELMSEGADCVRSSDTLTTAAQRMRELGVGSMPICGEDDRLAGIITDRDIVVQCVADGGDPSSTEVDKLAEGKPVAIGADDDVEEALRTMIRRPPSARHRRTPPRRDAEPGRHRAPDAATRGRAPR